MSEPITIRDPLWDTIHIDAVARQVIDSPTFQRLRFIKQLGHAHLVYPGATHTRFDHAVGVYHLATRALGVLRQSGSLDRIDPTECALIPLAALLHDVGHYPFSHALEELDASLIPGHHEALVGRFLAEPDVAEALSSIAANAVGRIETLIRGRSASPLQGLVSGSLDLDKIEYLKRDARFAGVPYGDVDVDRLLHNLLLLAAPDSDRLEIGVHEKGVAALESLLFAKYQMFRNVYWHHGVRAATVMYKRVVEQALQHGLVSADELVGATDEALMHLLGARADASGAQGTGVAEAVSALRARRLPKRAAEVSAGEIDAEADTSWLSADTPVRRTAECQIAEELGLGVDAVYLDFPEKPEMFGLDLLLRRRSGEVIRLGPTGQVGLIGLPRIADELYRSARVLRLYTTGERRTVPSSALAALARMSGAEVAARVERGAALLS